ncbi:uncharacterized protein RJT20DRAFT_126223 [Scheffersomyces xylosifermentans]|uniref:uncharacterized protein n=1 Tax=Scheffersomyces xylosifermentans TaxID=1304137 RepID=UPI00315CC849
MEQNWYYSPVAVRFLSKKENYATSGIHLVLVNTREQASSAVDIVADFILTVSCIPEIDQYRLLVNSNCENEDVLWYPARYSQEFRLAGNSHLVHQLTFFKENGFTFIPHDVLNSSNFDNLTVLKIELTRNGKESRNFVNLNRYRPFAVENRAPATGQPISITSFPFNFTNSLLFSHFLSTGTISYKLPENVGYLTDIKYLENMLGAVVTQLNDSSNSLGLVVGNLKKINGDGDLTMILPWHVIWTVIKKQENEANKSTTKLPTFVQFDNNKLSTNQWVKTFHKRQCNSVFPIYISSDSNSSWGTCIYYNEDTIITNFHVLKPFIDREDTNVKCDIYLTPTEVLSLTHDDLIYTPFHGIDLSFVKLSDTNLQQLNRLKSTFEPVSPSKGYKVGDMVKSRSFGLFFNSKHTRALESKGVINCKLKISVHANEGSEIVDSILITSSSCWNGSSGGALFMDDTNEFVGIICSNAQVKVPKLKDIDSAQNVEKLSRFSFILPAELIAYSYDYVMKMTRDTEHLNSKISDAWQLKTYHNDVVVESSKL